MPESNDSRIAQKRLKEFIAQPGEAIAYSTYLSQRKAASRKALSAVNQRYKKTLRKLAR